jgi:hypothetical protein
VHNNLSQPPSDADLRGAAELTLIASDIRWAWCFANDYVAHPDSSPHPLLCTLSYLSLIIFESHSYFSRADPTLGKSLALQYSTVIQQSRHRIKMFDDNKRGMEGISKYFSDGLIAAHHDKFIGSVQTSLPESWRTDLGLTTYDGRQVATTHVVHFNMGTPPNMLTNQITNLPKDIGEDMGRYLATVTALLKTAVPQLSWDMASFLSLIDASKLAVRDVRSSEYYGSRFGGQLPIGLLAGLDTFRCTLNSINLLISADTSANAAETQLKIRFVTLYHVLNGLQELRAAHSKSLNAAAIKRLQQLEQHPTSILLRQPSLKPLRNTLIHYGLDTRLPSTAIDLSKPMAGLVDYYLPNIGFTDLATKLREHTERVASSLNAWAT